MYQNLRKMIEGNKKELSIDELFESIDNIGSLSRMLWQGQTDKINSNDLPVLIWITNNFLSFHNDEKIPANFQNSNHVFLYENKSHFGMELILKESVERWYLSLSDHKLKKPSSLDRLVQRLSFF